jgi:hypothetical protein
MRNVPFGREGRPTGQGSVRRNGAPLHCPRAGAVPRGEMA